MSYEKTVWKNGDIITAEKMNKLENAVAQGASPLIVQQVFEQNQVRLDKTFGEIRSAFLEGRPVILMQRSLDFFTNPTEESRYKMTESLIYTILYYTPTPPADFYISIPGSIMNYDLHGESDNLNDYNDQYLSYNIQSSDPPPIK